MSGHGTSRTDGIVAGLLALLRTAPLGFLAAGAGGLPAPGSLNDPVRALTVIGASSSVTLVAATICGSGLLQLFIVAALRDRLTGHARRWSQLSVIFGAVSGSLLLVDGALGMTALPQLAQLDAGRADVDGAYLAVLGVRDGIDRVIPLTLGTWALTAHLPAWRRRTLPRPLVIVGVLLGAAGVAGAVLPAAGTISVVLAALWAVGFAIVLFRPVNHAGLTAHAGPGS